MSTETRLQTITRYTRDTLDSLNGWQVHSPITVIVEHKGLVNCV